MASGVQLHIISKDSFNAMTSDNTLICGKNNIVASTSISHVWDKEVALGNGTLYYLLAIKEGKAKAIKLYLSGKPEKQPFEPGLDLGYATSFVVVEQDTGLKYAISIDAKSPLLNATETMDALKQYIDANIF